MSLECRFWWGPRQVRLRVQRPLFPSPLLVRTFDLPLSCLECPHLVTEILWARTRNYMSSQLEVETGLSNLIIGVKCPLFCSTLSSLLNEYQHVDHLLRWENTTVVTKDYVLSQDEVPSPLFSPSKHKRVSYLVHRCITEVLRFLDPQPLRLNDRLRVSETSVTDVGRPTPLELVQ